MSRSSRANASLAALLLAGSVLGCTQQNQQNPPSAPPQQQPQQQRPAAEVDTQATRRGNIQASLSYTGDVRAKAQVAVIPRAAARIEEMRVDIGSEVKAGDIMAVLDRAILQAQLRQAQGSVAQAQAGLEALNNPRPEDIAIARANVIAAQDRLDRIVNPPIGEVNVLRAQLANAEADLKNAQSSYDRIAFEPDAGRRPEAVALERATNAYNIALTNLQSKLSPPQQDVDVARQSVETAEQQLAKALQPNTDTDLARARGALLSAQGQVEVAQVNVSEATIRAPIDGIVAERPLPIGATTSVQAAIITLVSRDVEVVLPVEETRLSEIQNGTRAVLNVAAYPGQDIAATVTSIAPTVDQRSRTIQVRVEPTTQDGRLKQGMFAQIRLIVGDRQNVVIAPKDAVVTRDGQTGVFVIADGRARFTRIETGVSDDRNIEIRSGVDQGVPVITSGLASLRDGDQVTPRQPARPGGAAPGGAAPGGAAPGGAAPGGAAPGAATPASGQRPAGAAPAGTPSPAAGGR